MESSVLPPNTLKSEHLNPDVRPIMFCVGTKNDFKDEPGLVEKIYRHEDDEAIENVDYAEDKEILTKNGFKNPEEESYVISPISNKDKISSSFKNCTGVVVSGKNKEKDEFLSFLSHEWPEYFLARGDEEYELFLRDLKERMIELKNKCVPGTIDAVIFGGNYAVGDREVDQWNDAQKNKTFREDYFESVQLLADTLSEILGFEPPVITGPQISLDNGDEEDVYYDNGNRRLYIVRPEVGDSSTESYMVGDIKQQESKWVEDVLSKKRKKNEEVLEIKQSIYQAETQKKTIYEKLKKLFE